MMNSVPLFYFFLWWFVLSVVVSEDALAPSNTTTTTTTGTTSQLQQNLEWYNTCGTPFSCGNLTGIGFPFWGGTRPHTCGYPGLNLTCTTSTTATANSKNKTLSTTTISIKGLTYRVLSIDQIDQTVTLSRQDLTADICVDRFANTTLDLSLYDYALGSQNMTLLYGCTETYENGYGSADIPGKFQCSINGTSNVDGYVLTGAMGPTSGCYASVVVPTLGFLAAQLQGGSLSLEEVISAGFQVMYKVGGDDECRNCTLSNGRCGYDLAGKKATVCVCSDGRVELETCSQSDLTSKTPSLLTEGKRSHSKSVIGISIGVGLGVAALLVGVWSLVRRRRRSRDSTNAKASPLMISRSKSNGTTTPTSSQVLMASSSPSTYYSHSHSQSDQYSYSYASYSTTTTTTIRRSTSDVATAYFGVRVFSYDELEQATDNFDDERELGDGGYGTVYYGQLPDGHPIAVKRLYENSFKRVEQFMNEIEILARLRHDHLVTLYGCTSRRSRELLLVYEYVPNGTVADHLHGHHGNGISNSINFLPWPTRLNIAAQTADALAYLHRSEIVHRDVKTANVLLDQRFRVKVADFGLSRLYPNDVTHVSTAPRGTPGYVDPEYHQCYRLTEKSDVYSFGVVLVELLSSKQAVDITRHRHDINLSNMAVDRIRKGALGELVDTRLGFGGVDPEVDREIKVVAELAFRCLQQDRDDRPSMDEVFQRLKSLLSCSDQTQTDTQTIQEVEVVKIICQSDDDDHHHHQVNTSLSDSTNLYRHTIQ